MRKIVCELLKLLEQNGYQAYLIGGYPRDFYLGIPTSDYDICTSATPKELREIFVDIIEENYGSLKINYQGILFEITTFRVEVAYKNVRTPTVTYTKSLKEDLLRRDFVMNTLCMNSKGEYIDLLGARKDIENKVIRGVGDNFQKMKEDPLRILRAIRFSSVLNFEIEDTLEEAIIKNKDLVKNLSYYRKKEELDKILNNKNVNRGIQLLKKYGLDYELECSFPNLVYVSKLEGMWAQIEFSQNYPFTRKEKKEIVILKRILSKGRIEDIDLYKYGFDLLSVIAPVLNCSLESLKMKYQSFPIHNFKEIDIDKNTIEKLCKENLSTIISVLEEKIIKGSLMNERKEIEKFLKSYF